ncbi:gluconokinase [Bacillus sp. JCM 19045]|nr:gluconokinase [Bacillus sp. JCM 19045]
MADNRSAAIINELKQTDFYQDFYKRTGTPIHPMSWIGKLKWFNQNNQVVFKKAAKFISIKEYICQKLFGEYVVDEAIAGGTGVYHLTTKQWDQDILDYIGVNREKLSVIVPTTYEFTKRTSRGKQALPYSNCRFIIGASDGVLANVGTFALTSDVATVTIGTSGAVRMHTKQPSTDSEMRTFCYALTEDDWIAGGATNNGGIALQWYIDQFAKGEKTVDIIKEALTVPPGANGLFFLPFLNGERAPYWNPDTRGAFIGISATHQRAHFSRAVLEGILFSIQSVLAALEETIGPVKAIHASGGFARSEEWVQMLADITGKRVRLPQSHHASALGAVRLAKHALGIESLTENSEVGPTVNFEPFQKHVHTYASVFHTYEKLYQSLEPVFPEIIKQQQVNNNIIM